MSCVNWELREDVLVGAVGATSIVDDQAACRATEDLKDGVSTHVLESGAAATGADTKVLVDFSALQGASASLAARLGQLIETWHDLNIEFKLCDVPHEVLEALDTAGTDRLVKIYENQGDALAAFRGQDVPTITTAAAKKRTEEAAREPRTEQPHEVTKVAQVFLNIRAAVAILADSIGSKSRRQRQKSKVIRIAIPFLVLASMIGGFLIWQSRPRSAYQVAFVSGTLLLNGEPLSEIKVIFEPTGSEDNPYPGPASYGLTNSSGKFTLKTMSDGQPGAVVGNHRVRLLSIIDEDDPDFYSLENTNLLPDQYNVATTLTYLVPPEGTREALFDVKLEDESEDESKEESDKESEKDSEKEE